MYFQTTTAPIKHWARLHRHSNKSIISPRWSRSNLSFLLCYRWRSTWTVSLLITTPLTLPRILATIFFRDVNGTSVTLPFNLDINIFAMYRRTLNDTEKTDYISAVKCLQSRPAFEPRAISAIQSRFDDFQALHIQVADRVHLTVSTNKFYDALS